MWISSQHNAMHCIKHRRLMTVCWSCWMTRLSILQRPLEDTSLLAGISEETSGGPCRQQKGGRWGHGHLPEQANHPAPFEQAAVDCIGLGRSRLLGETPSRCLHLPALVQVATQLSWLDLMATQVNMQQSSLRTLGCAGVQDQESVHTIKVANSLGPHSNPCWQPMAFGLIGMQCVH